MASVARIRIPLEGGYDLQQDEYASPAARSVINLLVDGPTNRSRPGLRAFATAVPSVGAIAGIMGTSFTGTSRPQIIALVEFLDRIVGISADRRVYSFTAAGVCQDGTSTALPGRDVPRFLIDDDGRLLIFGGGATLVMGADFIARPFFKDDSVKPLATHGIIVDRILLVNDRSGDGNQVFYAFVGEHDFIDPGQFLNAGVRNDAVLALAELNGQMYMFGAESIEWWYGTGDTTGGRDPFNLERSLPSEYGLGPVQSVLKADNTLWWMDRQRRILRLDGTTPKIVSLPIERQIEQFGTVDDCVAQFVEICGKHLVSWTFEKAKTTVMFDVTSGAWTEWRRWDDGWTAMPLQAYARQRKWNRHFCGDDRTSGAVLELDRNTHTDSDLPLRAVRRGPFVDGGTPKTKSINYADVVLDRGGGIMAEDDRADVPEDLEDPVVEVSWRNEGRAWCRARPLSLGTVGDNRCVYTTRMLGSYKRRQSELVVTARVQFSISRWEEDVRIGVA